jgi:redox-sensitive bicupin YhaK (pirin superfamily)
MSRIIHRITARPASDGAGVRIKRATPNGDFSIMDPFLMLDEIRSDDASDYAAGFPSHPHRGFETVTYMRQGVLEHQDHMGNRGVISSGGAQWMTAGHGVIHSEMPLQKDGAFHGFQLWLNLPADEKLRPAQYHNLAPEDVPKTTSGAHRISVLGGSLQLNGATITGPIGERQTLPHIWDIELNDASTLTLPIDTQLNVLLYIYNGEVMLGNETASINQLLIVDHDGEIQLTASTKTDPAMAKVLLLAGKPLQEPVAQYGPFVMNTREQIEEAIRDYQMGTLTSS